MHGSKDVRNHILPAVPRTYLSNFGTSKPVFKQFSSLPLRTDVSPIGLNDRRRITDTVTDFSLRRLIQTGYEVSRAFFFYGAAALLRIYPIFLLQPSLFLGATFQSRDLSKFTASPHIGLASFNLPPGFPTGLLPSVYPPITYSGKRSLNQSVPGPIPMLWPQTDYASAKE